MKSRSLYFILFIAFTLSSCGELLKVEFYPEEGKLVACEGHLQNVSIYEVVDGKHEGRIAEYNVKDQSKKPKTLYLFRENKGFDQSGSPHFKPNSHYSILILYGDASAEVTFDTDSNNRLCNVISMPRCEK
jgi:hypothetical protein